MPLRADPPRPRGPAAAAGAWGMGFQGAAEGRHSEPNPGSTREHSGALGSTRGALGSTRGALWEHLGAPGEHSGMTREHAGALS